MATATLTSTPLIDARGHLDELSNFCYKRWVLRQDAMERFGDADPNDHLRVDAERWFASYVRLANAVGAADAAIAAGETHFEGSLEDAAASFIDR